MCVPFTESRDFIDLIGTKPKDIAKFNDTIWSPVKNEIFSWIRNDVFYVHSTNFQGLVMSVNRCDHRQHKIGYDKTPLVVSYPAFSLTALRGASLPRANGRVFQPVRMLLALYFFLIVR